MAVAMHVAAQMTKAEFLRLPEAPPGLRMELLDGEVITMNSPTLRHQIVGMRIAAALDAWCTAAPGRGLVAPEIDTEPRRDQETIFIPDIQWFAADRELPSIDTRPFPAGDIVVEILSPRTKRHDTETKLARYVAGGAQEVWLVDPVGPSARIVRAGVELELGPGDAITSPLLPGFELPLARVRAG